MRDPRDMDHRSSLQIPEDLRVRLEVARLDLLALFRALDRLDLSAQEIPSASYANSWKQMPIMPKLFGRWTKWRDAWMGPPCSATPAKHWTNYHRPAPSFGDNCPRVSILLWNTWKPASARN
jgi:hypothetical protein